MKIGWKVLKALLNITDASSSQTTSGNNIQQAFKAYFQEHSLSLTNSFNIPYSLPGES